MCASPPLVEDNGSCHETDDAVSLSDTLSAGTLFASLRDEVQAELSGAIAPTALDEAAPGVPSDRARGGRG